MRIGHFVFAVFLVLLCNPSIFATTVVAKSLPQVIKDSELIVDGTVQSVSSFRNKRGLICTKVQISVDQYLKGEKTDSIFELSVPGGIYEGKAMYLPGYPRFQKGEEAVLFLSAERGGESSAYRSGAGKIFCKTRPKNWPEKISKAGSHDRYPLCFGEGEACFNQRSSRMEL